MTKFTGLSRNLPFISAFSPLSHIIGIDIEMAIKWLYLEACSIINGLLKHVFWSISGWAGPCQASIPPWPHDDLVFSQEMVTLNFHNGISLLQEDRRMEDGEIQPDLQIYSLSHRLLAYASAPPQLDPQTITSSTQPRTRSHLSSSISI